MASNNEYVPCPICKYNFKKKRLSSALEAGCLTFPTNVTPIHNYKIWRDKKDPTISLKRRCLEHMWNRVLNQDYIINHLPSLCERMKERMPDMLKSALDMKRLNPADVLVLKKAVDTLETQSDSFVPDPENYEGKWGLEYKSSPTINPFPQNLEDIVTRVVYTYGQYSAIPNEAEWDHLINDYNNTNDNDNVNDDDAPQRTTKYKKAHKIFSDCSKTMRSAITLIDFFRGSLGEGTF